MRLLRFRLLPAFVAAAAAWSIATTFAEADRGWSPLTPDETAAARGGCSEPYWMPCPPTDYCGNANNGSCRNAFKQETNQVFNAKSAEVGFELLGTATANCGHFVECEPDREVPDNCVEGESGDSWPEDTAIVNPFDWCPDE